MMSRGRMCLSFLEAGWSSTRARVINRFSLWTSATTSEAPTMNSWRGFPKTGPKPLQFSQGVVEMAFGTTHASNLLKLVYQATAESLIADNTATTPITNTYVSLHTASPASGNQQTSE